MFGKTLILAALLGAAGCREYNSVAAEAVDRVAPSAEHPRPVATVSAQSTDSRPPAGDAGVP